MKIQNKPSAIAATAMPLQGIRVLDFTWGGAGPFATKVLADHGAEVIKVETNTHYDFPRTMGPYADGKKGVNRSAYFTNRNSSKRSIAIDLKKKEAAAALKKIIPTVDVVINNFRAGVVEKLGFGYQSVSALKPDVIYVSMPLQGSAGPQANFSGVGHTLNVMSGIYGLTGYEDGVLVGPGTNYPDHSVNPGHAVVAIMSALIHRRRTGVGQYIEVSQLESTMNLLGPEILAYSRGGQQERSQGNSSRVFAPYGVFAAKEEWIALSIETDAEWQELCSVADKAVWAADTRFSTMTDRLQNAEDVNALIAGWLSTRDAFETMKMLQAAGIRAGVVQTARDIVERDEQIAARNALISIPHIEMGDVVYNNVPYKMSRTPAQLRTAPLIGEHNREVFCGWAGINDEEYARLEELDVFN